MAVNQPLMNATMDAEAQKDLREAKELLQATIDSTLDIIQVFKTIRDENNKIVDFIWIMNNKQGILQNGDVVGHTILSKNPGVIGTGIFYKMIQVIETGVPIEHEQFYDYEQFNGWYYQALVKSGDDGLVMTSRDITQQKKANEEIQSILLKLSDSLRPLTDIPEIQKAATNVLAEYFHGMRANFFEVKPDEDTLVLTANSESDRFQIPNQLQLSDFSPKLANDYRSGRTLMVNDTENEELRDPYRAIGVRAWLAAPLVRSGSLVAIVGILSKIPRHWTDADIVVIQEVAQRTWLALEKAKAEEALRESEERLQLSVRGANLFTWEVDLQTGETKYSDNANEVLGFELETVSDKNFINIHPRDKNFVETAISKAMKGEAPLDVEHRIVNPFTKEIIWVRAQGQLTRRKIGDTPVLMGTTQNITNRKTAEERVQQSEERYRIALDSADMAAWDWDIVGDTIQWNDQHFYNLGLKPGNPSINVAFFMSFLYPDDVKKINDALQLAINETGVFREEYRIIRADNKELRWMSAYGKATSTENGKATRMVGVMYDVTERKKLEQQKEDFIGAASHELKTPVTSIKMYGQILLKKMETSRALEDAPLITKLNGQVDRLARLINHMLDTTRISEGKLVLKPVRLDIDALLTEKAEEIARTTTHHFEINASSCQTIVADPEQIGQVITNLLSNAIKYSPPATVIKVSSRISGQWVEIIVTDDGYGISENDQQKIFDRFYRVTSNNMDTFPGMGLGLYISAQIVQLHGGSMSVKSKPGDGSEFRVSLPLTAMISKK